MTVDSKGVFNQWLPATHVGSFIFLLFVSTFRPVAIWPQWSLSLEPIAILLLFTLFVFKVITSIGIKAFVTRYKFELSLLSAYFTVCLLSLYLHIDYYGNVGEIVRYGITFIVITIALPVALFTFSLPNSSHVLSLSRFKYSCYIPYIVIGLLAILAIWQALAPVTSEFVTQFFISGSTASEYRIYNVNSIFQTATDTGSILAVMLIFVIYSLVQLRPQGRVVDRQWYIAVGLLSTLLILVAIAGLYNGKRIFILTVLFPIAFAAIAALRIGSFKAISAVIAITIAVHVMILLMPEHAFNKLAKVLPYLAMIKTGSMPTLASLVPNISMETVGPRFEIWSNAIDVLQGNWWLGVSNGGFRLSGGLVEQNTHNILLQILVEAGIVGLLILVSLFTYFRYRHRATKLVKLMPIVVCLSLVVDYFPDHCVPWIIVVAYLTMFVSRYERINYEE